MNLKYGKNEIKYVVAGTITAANIFLWNYSEKLVISDIDGTITK